MPLAAKIRSVKAAAAHVEQTSGELPKMPKAPKTPFSVKGTIDLYYKDQAKNPGEGRQDGILSPSQLTKCLRKQQLKLIQAKKNPVQTVVKILKIFDTGHASEARFRKRLEWGCKQIGATWTPSVKSGIPMLFLFGETDGIITLKDGTRWLVDFKTINKAGYTALQRPDTGYIWQFHAYMRMFGIAGLICYYECKDNCEDREFIVLFNEDTWTEITAVINQILEATSAGELLPIDQALCDSRNCEYQRICFSNPEFDDADRRSAELKKRLPVIRG